MDTNSAYTLASRHGHELRADAAARREVRSTRRPRGTNRAARRAAITASVTGALAPVGRSPALGTLGACCLAEPA